MGSDAPAPTPSETTDSMLNAYQKYLPGLLKTNADNFLPTAQAELKSAQAVSPAYTQLQQQLYDTYGPLLGDTSNRINAAQQKSQATSDLDTLNGPGGQLINQALSKQKEIDPEYYATRSLQAGRLGDLLGSINLGGGLSGGEKAELERSQARENSARGLGPTTGSQTAALANALTFGSAQRQRENENKGQLAGALGVGNAMLPTLQSGQDAFQIGTGRSSMPNAGDSKFLGVDKNASAGAQNTQNQFLGLTGGFAQQKNAIDSQRRDELDRFNQSFSSVVGSL